MPDDIALAGFDEIYWPVPDMVSVTTVIQPAYDLGRTAANRLIQHIRQPDAPRHEIILPYRFIIGESSRPHVRPGLLESGSSPK